MSTERVVTAGSVWVFDPGGRYCRMPRHEGPREDPEWGSADAGNLQDFVWHDLTGVAVIERGASPCLRIVTADGGFVSTGTIEEGLDVALSFADAWPCDIEGPWPRYQP